MKCFQCKKEIENELDMVTAAPDGDCYCNDICYAKFKINRAEFFDNIGNDNWYTEWLKRNT